eukprot:CAMPEP_0184706542 /NCGR_PEP_ID=MMETSP0313-20130426/36809_1 /TAXON_ID=2792 /ORGANISM="Porphyridium aerugineum, Strain SAG 1380-2" /LENGTH=522 /DNA_ID=CAMNT_0027168095 /DNA_START=625 /DNA_END=2193 /DNA_ORIENTATION=-
MPRNSNSNSNSNSLPNNNSNNNASSQPQQRRKAIKSLVDRVVKAASSSSSSSSSSSASSSSSSAIKAKKASSQSKNAFDPFGPELDVRNIAQEERIALRQQYIKARQRHLLALQKQQQHVITQRTRRAPIHDFDEDSEDEDVEEQAHDEDDNEEEEEVEIDDELGQGRTLLPSSLSVSSSSSSASSSVSASSSKGSSVSNRGFLSTYLKEIASVDMLTEEELEMCAMYIRRLLKWEELRTSLKSTLQREPTVSEWAREAALPEQEFVREVNKARRHKDRLVAANLRLVVSIAKRYGNLGVNMLDLIQEGSLGLIRGAEKFDYSKGYRFATYVSWWIKHFVQRALVNHSRAIRLPQCVEVVARKIVKARAELKFKYGRDPSNSEIAQFLQLPIHRVNYVMQKSSQTTTISLDVPLNEGGSVAGGDKCTRLVDTLQDQSEIPEEMVMKQLMKDDLEAVLLMLTPREREIVRLRYGFDDGNSRNYDEIGNLYCVPGNRIRQIEARALRKLRHPSFNSTLKEYIKC